MVWVIARIPRPSRSRAIPAQELPGREIVEVGGGFVEDEEAGGRDERAGECDPAPLATGDGEAVLADLGRDAVGERGDPAAEAGARERGGDLAVVRLGVADADVGGDRGREEVSLLPVEAHRVPHVGLGGRAEVGAAERDRAAVGIVEADEQVRERRLPGAARTDDGDPGRGLQAERDAVERGCCPARVADGRVHDRQVACPGERAGLRRIGDGRLAVGHLLEPSGGGSAGAELLGSLGERSDRLEGRERSEDERGQQHGVEPVGVDGGNGNERDRERERAGEEHARSGREPAGERVARLDTGERRLAAVEAGGPVGFAAVDRELRRSGDDLEEVAGQRGARGRLAPPGRTCERSL